MILLLTTVPLASKSGRAEDRMGWMVRWMAMCSVSVMLTATVMMGSASASVPVDFCREKSVETIVRYYSRGVQAVPLRCGTERWGFKHIVLRGRWTAAFDAQIAHTVARGTVSRDKTVYARFNKDCEELFRIIANPNAIYGDGFSPQGIITAYPIVGTMMGTSSRSDQVASGGPCLVTEPVDGTGRVAGREVDA